MRKTLIAWAVVLLAAFPLAAQTNPTGTIAGRVTDDQGLAVPGVTVTGTSPVLQGSRSQVSSANGDYILPYLPPGEYAVTYELSGFATVKRTARVVLNGSETLNVGLKVAGASETIEVVGAAPEDFGKGATGATSFTRETAELLPLNRTFQQLAQLTPGVTVSGPGGNITISGAMSFENLFMVNGVVVQDNVRSTPFNLFIEDALQETTTTTNAVSAEFGRFSGGVVNTITKSGGNEFSGSFRTTFDNDKWVSTTPYPDDRRVTDVIPTYEGTLGGPIVRDKLWFFGAGRWNDQVQALSTSITRLPYELQDDERRFEGKLTFSPLRDHTFKGSYSKITRDQVNQRFGSVMDLASLHSRQLPQELISANYTGILNPKFFVEAQYSKRDFTFVGSGSQFIDRVRGTLLLDRSRANSRYNSPTFCGVCDDERRDNNNYVVKTNYFLSTGNTGTHSLVGGVDVFDDKRFSNNHQSGSDFRVFTTSSIGLADGTVVPVLNNDGSTFIRWTPIFQDTSGNRFRTVSAFLNDAWTLNNRLTINLGVRYDKNDGQDSLGNVVVKDAAFSPRLSASFDPRGDGKTTFLASYGKYVAGIANAVGDTASAGGQPATIDFTYLGPPVNVGAAPSNATSTEQALNTLFDWFDANGGTRRSTRGAPTVPGVTSRISDRLKSPNVDEYKLGLTQALGSRGRARIDAIYRKYQDFYSTRQDLSTGTNTDQFGQPFDYSLIENSNVPTRRYQAINLQMDYRPLSRLNLGGNYTLSRSYGTFDGETTNGGPGSAAVAFYPEYFDLAWGSGGTVGGGGPEGDLLNDVRHRARAWAVWEVPVPAALGKVNVSWFQIYNSGSPYGAVGIIDSTPFVTNPGYVTPPEANQEYFFTARDAFRMESTHSSDVALNYSRPLAKKAEIFFRFVMNNVFNNQNVTNFFAVGCGVTCINTTVRTNNNQSSLTPFNPFTEQPVEGVHWAKASGAFGSNFGDPLSRFAYQTPRTYNFSVGFRF